MNKALKVGGLAPQISWEDNNGKKVQLQDFLGNNVVLYFYPKDNTPGCTIEARAFASKHEEFMTKNAVVFGISRDSASSHKFFSSLCGLPFTLISDVDGTICTKFNVLKQKTMFGKKYIGIHRSTFLIDPSGKISKIWEDVSVETHAQEVLDSI